MSNYLKSKGEALGQFKNNCNNFPLWKIYELGKRNPIFTSLIEGDESNTIKNFEAALKDLYPDKIYTVQLFRNLLHRKGGQKFINPNFEFSFQFNKEEQVLQPPVISGVPSAPSAPTAIIPAPYSVDVRQQIGLSEHISIIQAKAKAESDNEYLKNIIKDQAKLIADSERKIEELEKELEELEQELDELEEELDEQEKEEEKIAGTEDTSIESAIASVIKENGGVVLENLMSKGVKGAPDFTEENEEQQQEEPKVNGIPDNNLMDMSIPDLNMQMLTLNPKWKQHLVKLILIGKQKPITFKMFMSKLESF